MRWKPGMLGAVLVLTSTLAVSAECGKDLSGEWSRETAPDASPDEAYRAEGSGWSDRIRVVQADGRVVVESFFFTKGDLQPPLRFSFAPEGTTENVVMVGQGMQRQISTARWSECRFVITTRYPVDGNGLDEVTVKQTLWLDSGNSLVVETARGAVRPNRTTYRRVAPAGGT